MVARPVIPASRTRESGSRSRCRCWKRACPIPEIPVVSVVDLGIVRAVDAGPGDDHADLYRLPRHPGDRARHPRRARRRRLSATSRSRPSSSPPWTTDWISESGKAKLHAYGIAPPTRRARPSMPAMRLDRHRGDQPLRLDARARRNGAAAPASSRSTCSSATDERRLSTASTVAEMVDETAEAMSIRFDVPEELRETFKFKPGQHLDAEGRDRRRGSAAQLFALRRAAGRAGEGHGQADRRRRLLQLGERQSEARRPIEVMPPHGSFTWDFEPGAANHYVGFAGGSGITPVMSLLKTALLTEPESRFTLFYGNRDSSRSSSWRRWRSSRTASWTGCKSIISSPRRPRSIELFNGMLDRAKCDEILEHSDRSGRRRRLLHLRPRPDDGRGRGGAARRRASPQDRIHLERFTADRPSAALEAQMQALTAGGGGPDDAGHPRRPQAPGRLRRRGRQHPRQRPRRRACPRPSPARPASARPAGRGSSRARSRWRRATASPTRRWRRAMC